MWFGEEVIVPDKDGGRKKIKVTELTRGLLSSAMFFI